MITEIWTVIVPFVSENWQWLINLALSLSLALPSAIHTLLTRLRQRRGRSTVSHRMDLPEKFMVDGHKYEKDGGLKPSHVYPPKTAVCSHCGRRPAWETDNDHCVVWDLILVSGSPKDKARFTKLDLGQKFVSGQDLFEVIKIEHGHQFDGGSELCKHCGTSGKEGQLCTRLNLQFVNVGSAFRESFMDKFERGALTPAQILESYDSGELAAEWRKWYG